MRKSWHREGRRQAKYINFHFRVRSIILLCIVLLSFLHINVLRYLDLTHIAPTFGVKGKFCSATINHKQKAAAVGYRVMARKKKQTFFLLRYNLIM